MLEQDKTVKKDGMTRARLIFFRTITLAMALLVAIILVEIFLRLAKPFTRIYYPAGRTFEAIYVPDRDCVYGLKPNTVYKHYSYYGDFVATYRLNSEGLRADRNYGYAKPNSVKRILILGDSYAFGRGVENNETSAAVLENLLNKGSHEFEVLNSGVLGYSTDNEFVYLEKKGLIFEPDVIILMMFPRNDIMDMAFHEWITNDKGLPVKIIDRYYAVDSSNHLVDISRKDKNLMPSRLKEAIRNNSYLYTFLSENRYYFKMKWQQLKFYWKTRNKKMVPAAKKIFDMETATPTEKEMMGRAFITLKGMRELANHNGAHFLLVVIPDSEYDETVIDFAKSEGIDLVDIGAVMKKDRIPDLYLPKDMHWSRLGNAYVAAVLSKYIKNLNGK